MTVVDLPGDERLGRVYELADDAWAAANRHCEIGLRRLMRLAIGRLEALEGETDLRDADLGEIDLILEAVSDQATTRDITVPARNARQILYAIRCVQTDGGRPVGISDEELRAAIRRFEDSGGESA